jgi:hypothetical protein
LLSIWLLPVVVLAGLVAAVLVDYALAITVLRLDHPIQLPLVLAAREVEQVFHLIPLRRVMILFLEILLHLVVRWAAVILGVTAVLEVVAVLHPQTLLFLAAQEYLGKEMLVALVTPTMQRLVAMVVAVVAQEQKA